MPEEEIGVIKHYFTKLGVAVLELTKGDVKAGDRIHIKRATSDFTQKIDSMQIEQLKIEEAKKGQSVGIKVTEQVRKNDKVFKVTE